MRQLKTAPSLTMLIAELLDAHLDTIEMALELPPADSWSAHVEYLQALRRQATVALALDDPDSRSETR